MKVTFSIKVILYGISLKKYMYCIKIIVTKFIIIIDINIKMFGKLKYVKNNFFTVHFQEQPSIMGS